MKYDYILKSEKIYTLDDGLPMATWIAVKDKKIAEVGMDPFPEGEIIKDLGKNTIIPGLIDSHVHGGTTAVMLSNINLAQVTSIEETLELINEKCKTTDEDLVIASFFIQPQIREGRYPTRQELDKVSHGKKVAVISFTLHGSSINTKAYESIHFPPGLEGIMFKEGEFTGELASDEAHMFALAELLGTLSLERYEGYIDAFGEMCRSFGLTTVHCLEGQFMKDDLDLDLWIKKIADGSLPFHCVLYPQIWEYKRALKYNLPRHGGCLTLDGADIDYTMAMFEPYAGRPEVRGNLFRKDNDLYELVSAAHADGKQCSFHAMGDRAIDQILWIYYRVIKEQGQKNLRHRIEHFSMATPAQVKMAADLGIVVSEQPEFTYLYETPGGPEEEIFGPTRAHGMELYRAVSDAGVVLAGGSDAPVNSLNPLTGIHALVNSPNPGRKFDVTGALKVYTQNCAYAAFEENERGTIKKDYFADFTVLEDDPYEQPHRINEIKVTHTFSEGRQVFGD